MVMTVIPVEQNDIIVNDCQRWAKQGFPYGDGSFIGQGFKRNDKSTGVETMMGSSRTYLPAAGHDWSLPLYDPIRSCLAVTRPGGRCWSKRRCGLVSAFSTWAAARALWPR